MNSNRDMYCTTDHLRTEIRKMAPLGDFYVLKEEIKTLAKNDDVVRTFTAIKSSLEK